MPNKKKKESNISTYHRKNVEIYATKQTDEEKKPDLAVNEIETHIKLETKKKSSSTKFDERRFTRIIYSSTIHGTYLAGYKPTVPNGTAVSIFFLFRFFFLQFMHVYFYLWPIILFSVSSMRETRLLASWRCGQQTALLATAGHRRRRQRHCCLYRRASTRVSRHIDRWPFGWAPPFSTVRMCAYLHFIL